MNDELIVKGQISCFNHVWFETRYLSLCDDVEGAALLSLPDDILPFVVVFLMGRERRGEEGERGGRVGVMGGGRRQSELKHYIDLTIDRAGLIPGSRSPAG